MGSKKSISQLTVIAENGDAQAAMILARAYRSGDGVSVDYDTAVLWYERAAKKDVWAANFELSVIYRDGLLDQNIDMEKAMFYLKEESVA